MAKPWLNVQHGVGRPCAARCTLPQARRQPRLDGRRLWAGASASQGQEAERRPSLFIFGMGYTGIALANYFRHRGWNVVGTVRSEEKRDALRAKGFQVFDFAPDEYELLGGSALECLEAATHVISTVPPEEEEVIEDPVLMAHMRHLGDSAQRYRWLGYVSSTSVYGNHEGDWVNEWSEVRATSGKGFVRLMAEHEWLHLFYNYQAPVHIFRCGGIYGPRRSAIEAVRQSGLPSASQQRRMGQRYTARVHVYDICQTVEASMQRPNPGAVYNVVDDDPAGRLEVMRYAAQLLREAEPGRVPALAGGGGGSSSVGAPSPGAGAGGSLGDPGASQSGESSGDEAETAGGLAAAFTPAKASSGEKRVSNQRIKRDLGVRLAFPTYREGLAAILRKDDRPFD